MGARKSIHTNLKLEPLKRISGNPEMCVKRVHLIPKAPRPQILNIGMMM